MLTSTRDPRIHLKLLAASSNFLSNNNNRKKILSIKNRNEFIEILKDKR